jgi:nitrogen fixation NifU-like protein
MALNYTEKVMDHFLHPRNVGEIENPDGYAEVGSPVCGDMLSFFIKVGRNDKGEDVINDIKYLSFGCASNIATASMLTEEIMGKTLEDAKKLKFKQIVDDLGGLPQQKFHCSVLAVEGLQKAIEDYENKNKK